MGRRGSLVVVSGPLKYRAQKDTLRRQERYTEYENNARKVKENLATREIRKIPSLRKEIREATSTKYQLLVPSRRSSSLSLSLFLFSATSPYLRASLSHAISEHAEKRMDR